MLADTRTDQVRRLGAQSAERGDQPLNANEGVPRPGSGGQQPCDDSRHQSLSTVTRNYNHDKLNTAETMINPSAIAKEIMHHFQTWYMM